MNMYCSDNTTERMVPFNHQYTGGIYHYYGLSSATFEITVTIQIFQSPTSLKYNTMEALQMPDLASNLLSILPQIPKIMGHQS